MLKYALLEYKSTDRKVFQLKLESVNGNKCGVSVEAVRGDRHLKALRTTDIWMTRYKGIHWRRVDAWSYVVEEAIQFHFTKSADSSSSPADWTQ